MQGDFDITSQFAVDGRKRKNIFINLTKLQTGTLASLQDEALAMDTVFLSTEGSFIQGPVKKSGAVRKKSKEPQVKRKVIKSVKQFFGPVVDPPKSPSLADEENEELPVVNFR